MKLYAVRHGQADHNKRFRLNDDPADPSNLTTRGRQQAEMVAAQLSGVQFERIFMSELPRTHQTADIINRFHHVPIEIDARLNDIRTGFGGQPVWRWALRLLFAAHRANKRHRGGESLDEAKARIDDFIAELRQRQLKNALIVGHQHTLQSLNSLLDGTDYTWALKRPIGHTTVLEFDLT